MSFIVSTVLEILSFAEMGVTAMNIEKYNLYQWLHLCVNCVTPSEVVK